MTDKYEWKLAYYFEFHTPYFETADMAEGQMKAAQDGGVLQLSESIAYRQVFDSAF